jgi:predicted transcriptional regulator
MPVTSSSNWTHPARFRTATVGLSFFKDLIYIPKIQLTTEKKGQGMAKAKSKNPMGRPKFEVTPEVLQEVEEMAGRGLTVNQIASCLGISPSTFYLRQAEFSEFSETIKKGQAIGLSKVTNKLFENAAVKGDNVAIIYYLNNRDKENWSNKNEFSATVEHKNIIDLTRVSDDQLSAITAAFKHVDIGEGSSGNLPQVIEGVYESSMADD